MAGWDRVADEELRCVDLCPRAAAGDIDERIGSKPPEVGQAEPAACGDEPTLLGLRNPVGPAAASNWHEGRLECLALFIGRRAVALDAEDPRAPLPVAAERAAADEACQIEIVSNVDAGRKHGASSSKNGARSGEMFAPAAIPTRGRTDIAARPGVDRGRGGRGRRRWPP